MSDILRRPEQNSPKTSPRGSRSPAYPRQDSTGTLKTTITLGKNPSIIHSGPFYLMTREPPESELTGSTNLMAHNGLEHSYNKFSGKKVKEELSAFLPNLPGNIDAPGIQDNSSLRSVIEKPPITKELVLLSGAALTGFRLHPGPLPAQYQLMTQMTHKKKRHKRHKKESSKEGPLLENTDNASDSGHDPHKKAKKAKRSDEEKEKKKRKKEKKKKKEKEKEEKAPQS